MAGDQWAPDLGCSGSATKNIGGCDLGIVSYYLGENGGALAANNFYTDTCRCDGVDDACQPASACEGAYVLDGLHVTPTVCVPFGEDGNPIKPGGPEVYGLNNWDEGLVVYGNDIVLSPAMIHGAVAWAGLWNDTQAFDLDGLITWCADDSLCAHLGLAKDDRVDVDLLELGRIALGGVADVTIEHDDGSSEAWTIAVELD